ncbi:hypothetical protein GPALN_006194 [Globodera pallida]|nr:hypothetical protein GPALN_006194 [Globodera pallida]
MEELDDEEEEEGEKRGKRRDKLAGGDGGLGKQNKPTNKKKPTGAKRRENWGKRNGGQKSTGEIRRVLQGDAQKMRTSRKTGKRHPNKRIIISPNHRHKNGVVGVQKMCKTAEGNGERMNAQGQNTV